MKTKKNIELKKFLALQNQKLARVRKNAEKANSEYEKVLKNFVVTHVTGKTNFKKRFNTEWRELCEDLRHQQPKDYVDEKMVYERMIEVKEMLLDEELE